MVRHASKHLGRRPLRGALCSGRSCVAEGVFWWCESGGWKGVRASSLAVAKPGMSVIVCREGCRAGKVGEWAGHRRMKQNRLVTLLHAPVSRVAGLPDCGCHEGRYHFTLWLPATTPTVFTLDEERGELFLQEFFSGYEVVPNALSPYHCPHPGESMF